MRDDRCYGGRHYGCGCTEVVDTFLARKLAATEELMHSLNRRLIEADDKLADGAVHLTQLQGQQVAEVLRRYVGVIDDERKDVTTNTLMDKEDIESEVRELTKDIDYIAGLVKLFGGEEG